MKKATVLNRLFCFMLLVNAFSAKAQLPDCDKIYMDNIDILSILAGGAPKIYTYDPALPVNATNPSLNTISFPNGWLVNGGLTVSRVLGSGNNTRTFYTINANDNKIWYYDPTTLLWTNTGHEIGNTAAVNLAAGGDYIYGLVGATGEVYQYDGTGNGTLLTTVNGFAGGGPYDLIADCDGNFYILRINSGAPNSPANFLRKYSPSGVLLQAWTINNPNGYVGVAGFAIVGTTFYMDNEDPVTGVSSIASGTIAGTVINLNTATATLPPYGNALLILGDLASCDAAIGLIAEITIASSETQICGSRNVSFWVTDTENGGTAPLYQWFVNGSPVQGATDTFYTYAPQNGDVITCRLTSNKNCVVVPTAISNAVTMLVETVKEPELSYTPNEFCIVSAPVLPVVNPVGGTFSSTGGLSLHPMTGEIKPTLSTTGTYIVTYVNPQPIVCPQYSTTTVVTVFPPADATIKIDGFKQPVCLNDTVVLYTNEVKGSIYKWEPSERIVGYSDVPSVIVKRNQAGYVSLTVYAKGSCMGQDSVWIDQGKSCCRMFVPSAFTPNGDAVNDLFKIEKKEVSVITRISIFNRYGQMVFEAGNDNIAWDGTHKNKDCDVGVYFYTISYSCDDGVQKELKGDVTLVR